MDTARADDPELAALREVTRAWADAIGTGWVNQLSVPKVLQMIEEGDAHNGHDRDHRYPELREAILASIPHRGRLNTRSVGKWLARYKGRIAGGLRFNGVSDKHGHAVQWWVEEI